MNKKSCQSTSRRPSINQIKLHVNDVIINQSHESGVLFEGRLLASNRGRIRITTEGNLKSDAEVKKCATREEKTEDEADSDADSEDRVLSLSLSCSV